MWNIAAVLMACCIFPSLALSLLLAHVIFSLLLIFSHTPSRLSPIAFLLVSITVDLPLHVSNGLVWIFQESSVSLTLLSGSCLATEWVRVYNPPPLFSFVSPFPDNSLLFSHQESTGRVIPFYVSLFLRVNKALLAWLEHYFERVMFIKSKCAK